MPQICLNQGSCHHFERRWPPKDITYNMNETHSQSNEATFFFSFFQQVDQKVSFPYPYFCLTTYGTDGKGACFGVPCPGHCRLRQPPEIETNRTQGQTLFRTQPGHLMCLTWFPVCQIFLDDFQISTSPSKDKDLLAGRIFKRIC